MPDRVQSYDLVGVIDPEQHAVFANSIFMKASEIRRQVLHWLGEHLGMGSKPFDLLADSLGNVSIEFSEIALKGRRRRDLIRSAHASCTTMSRKPL